MTILETLGRANLPAEFFDVTSAQMLVQPEPQYLHARLILAALDMELDKRSAMLGLPGRDVPDSGAAYSTLEQMQLDLSDPLYPESVTVNTDFMEAGGKLPIGHVLRFNRPKFVDTQYTFAAREIVAGQVIGKTPVTVGSDQVEVRIARYGGPLDPVSGVIAPIGISRFDAERSVHSLPAVRDLHFARDFHKTLDSFGVSLFNTVASGNTLFPVGMTQDSDANNVGDFPFSFQLLRSMQRRLDETSIPLFRTGRRLAVVTPYQELQLTSDPEYQRLAVFAPPKNPLLVGAYVGTVANIDVFKSTTLTQTANGNSVPIHQAQMFSPGMVGIAPGEMPRVVANTDDNYGEDPIAIWLFYCGFAVLDARFGVSGHSC